MAAITLSTPDELKYIFYPLSSKFIQFRVKAGHDAHLALTSKTSDEAIPMLEVFIGGWKNEKSVIRKNRNKPEVAEVNTPGILTPDEHRGFWIRFEEDHELRGEEGRHKISVGKEGERDPFMSYTELDDPFVPTYIGVCTGWGATGEWIIESPEDPTVSSPTPSAPSEPIQPSSQGSSIWLDVSGGAVPPNAFLGGEDHDEPLYVGRANHEGELVPGKVKVSHGVCYIPWNGQEVAKNEYQILSNCDGVWVQATADSIPATALPAGETSDGEPLFVGRVNHEGTLTVGKVHVSHGSAYIPYAGQEIAFREFEVLTAS